MQAYGIRAKFSDYDETLKNYLIWIHKKEKEIIPEKVNMDRDIRLWKSEIIGSTSNFLNQHLNQAEIYTKKI